MADVVQSWIVGLRNVNLTLLLWRLVVGRGLVSFVEGDYFVNEFQTLLVVLVF